jgi:ubiquinone/menaquinone biosynthesis C-methylase UbiE
MVSIRETTRKYRGRKAATYEAIRARQARWAWENEMVEQALRALAPSSVLDCPVGTGRFLPLYGSLAAHVLGLDASEEMLALARRKKRRHAGRHKLEIGDATSTGCDDGRYDVAVCVRFLDLIDEDAMRAVMRELCRVARRAVLLTIRFGTEYVPKSNTATHSRQKFLALVRRLGFELDQDAQFREAGWTFVTLTRRR